jgi:hypothetical protein
VRPGAWGQVDQLPWVHISTNPWVAQQTAGGAGPHLGGRRGVVLLAAAEAEERLGRGGGRAARHGHGARGGGGLRGGGRARRRAGELAWASASKSAPARRKWGAQAAAAASGGRPVALPAAARVPRPQCSVARRAAAAAPPPPLDCRAAVPAHWSRHRAQRTRRALWAPRKRPPRTDVACIADDGTDDGTTGECGLNWMRDAIFNSPGSCGPPRSPDSTPAARGGWCMWGSGPESAMDRRSVAL